jgi:hypothetical protein
MSTEIETKAEGVNLNQFSGGVEHGVMISINQRNFFKDQTDENDKGQMFLKKLFSSVHLTKDQAKQVAKDLLLWVDSVEQRK